MPYVPSLLAVVRRRHRHAPGAVTDVGGVDAGFAVNPSGEPADDSTVRARRRADAEQVRSIACRECLSPLELAPERMERLGGRTFIECGACRNLIWVRRSDLRRAVLAGPPDGAGSDSIVL